MRSYELVLVFRSSLAEAARKKAVDSIKDLFKGLKIAKEDNWGEKTLAYPIQKEKKGFYIQFVLEGDTPIPADLDKRLTANDSILRHLVVRTK